MEEENPHQVDIENEESQRSLYELRREVSNASSFSDRDMAGTIREPLLTSRINNTSQIAIVGANIYPIESLDYEYESFLTLFRIQFPISNLVILL